MDDLLIATWNRVFVRRAGGEIEPILEHGMPFYGLTWGEECLYVGARYWDIFEHDHLVVFDRALRRVDEFELPTGGMLHQILWYEGWLYLTDTSTDRVLRWSPCTRGWETVFDLGTGGDIHHINSLWHDGQHWWATGLHGHVWKDWKPWGQFPFEVHNIYIEDEVMIVCASRQQAVNVGGQTVSLAGMLGAIPSHMQEWPDHALRIITAEVITTADDMPSHMQEWPIFTHGLARGPDAFYVGAARLAERDERRKGDSAIVVFDPDWQVREVLHFEDVGGIHDIRVLGADRAHNGVAW